MRCIPTNYVFTAIVLLLMACGTSNTTMDTPAATAPEVVIQYMQGRMQTSSPDGATPYGPPLDVLVKRTVDEANGSIVEESWHGTEARISRLTLRSGTLIFDATDDANSFSGTMTFETQDWLKGNVTYDINMTDNSGRLTGTGTWSEETYSTDKLFSDPSGAPQAKIVESLTLISEAEFLAARPE